MYSLLRIKNFPIKKCMALHWNIILKTSAFVTPRVSRFADWIKKNKQVDQCISISKHLF